MPKLTKQTYIKPELSLSAQINKQCDVPTADNSLLSSTLATLEPLLKIDKLVYILAKIMLENGLRVSEALALSSSDSVGNGQYLIHGLKGSKSRIVDLSKYESDLRAESMGLEKFFHAIDRFYVYRCFKKVGMVYFTPNGKKEAVTHSLRHLCVQNLRSQGVVNSVIQNKIGHESGKNTENYGRGKKKGYNY